MMNSQKELICLLLILTLPVLSTGQDLQRLEVSFAENGKNLLFPLAGGLNSPQFSAVDLNKDGLLDLHVFDRVGDKQMTFLNTGKTDGLPYVFAPEYVGAFPRITNWMLLRDYNGDGIMDIFSYGDQNFDAVMVFTGYYEDGHIAFRRFRFNAARNVIYVPRPGGGNTQLYVSMVDYPAVDDIDCDGDLDILTFNLVGGHVEFYANQSVERGYGRDSLLYRLEDDCWGGFFESGVSNAVQLAQQPGACIDNFLTGELEVRHSGSTLLTFDADGDQDKELILGDISFNNLNFLGNGGNCELAWMNAQDFYFPSYDVPVDVPVFPAAYLADVDNDGLKDLLAAPNVTLAGADRLIWRYRNTGTVTQPHFQLVQQDFLVEHMIDLGSGARPVFVDYNADGLQDLVIANYSFYETSGEKNARLFLYENIGSLGQPAYRLVNDDYLQLHQFSQSTFAFTPCFGDLDGDGDADVLIGEQYGQLFFAENIAGAGNALAFGPVQYGYMGISVGQASVPQIVDLDRDGLPDLTVGERNGNINYFRNRGSRTVPAFNSAPDQMLLGAVDTRVPGFTTGYSSPFFFEENGRFLLLTGTEHGRLELYDQIDGNLSGAFSNVSEQYGMLQEGIRTHITLADIDNDGLLELAVGNFSGGVGIFKTEFQAGNPVSVKDPHSAPGRLSLWPNPATDQLWLRMEAPVSPALLSVYNAAGQLLLQQSWSGDQLLIPTRQWPAGIYLVQLEGADGRRIRRFLIQ